MPFLAQHHLPLPTQDITSWYFRRNPDIKDRNTPIYIDASSPSRHYTHRTAELTIRKLIAGFHSRGLKRGDVVCIHSFNSVDYPILVNGIVAAGAIFSGTNPSYTVPELRHAVRTARIGWFVVEPELLEQVAEVCEAEGIERGRVLVFDTLDEHVGKVPQGYESWRVLLESGDGEWEGWENDAERGQKGEVARMFSSGTTGCPKAATFTHTNFISQHTLVAHSHTAKDYNEKRLMSLPLFHVAAAPSMHFSPLRNGVQTFIMRRFALEPFLRSIKRYEITDLPMVPPMVLAVVMNSHLTTQPAMNLSTVRMVSSGAAPLDRGPQARLRKLLRRDASFTQVWGMTETTCIASNFPWPEDDETGSVGRSLPGLDVKLVHSDGRDISAFDVPGELCVRGPTVINGYYDNARANKESFDMEGYFKTGNVAFVKGGDGPDRGKWYIIDRLKELIKVRGFQVAPPELEAVLLAHPGIVDAAVVGVRVKDEVGAGDLCDFPRGYIVRRPAWKDDKGEEVSVERVKKYMAERLAGYKRLEGGVVFVDAVPRNPSGKILKRFRRERAAEEIKQERRVAGPKL